MPRPRTRPVSRPVSARPGPLRFAYTAAVLLLAPMWPALPAPVHRHDAAVAGESPIDALEVFPGELLLEGAGARQQLAATGRCGEGLCDLTALARYAVSDPAIAGVTAEGVVYAAGDGRATIEVSFGPHTVHVPVEVRGSAEQRPLTFAHDVMAVLSRAGCNAGACHGNFNGKNGFRLSLRGEDPAFDFARLTRDSLARRVNTAAPEQSLILLKPTTALPHEGGRRFDADSTEYAILHRWISEGARPDPADMPSLVSLEVFPSERVLVGPAGGNDQGAWARQQIVATARFSDGAVRDVTHMACYEASGSEVAVTPGGVVEPAASDGPARQAGPTQTVVTVRYLDQQASVRLAFVPARPEFAWDPPAESNEIDRLVFARLHALRIEPSEPAPDHFWLRRVYLDTIGVLPTPEETRAFLADTEPLYPSGGEGGVRGQRRERVVDALLQRPEFADLWALYFCDLLRVEEKVMDRKGVAGFHQWVRSAIDRGMPLDEFARELLAARGSTYDNPPANYYRTNRTLEEFTETTAQVFLGIRIGCARCHNHPFDRWTMDDYYGLGAFYARVRYRIVENNRRDRFDLHEFDGEQIVWMDPSGAVEHPRTGERLVPRFLGAETPAFTREDEPLEALADWVASPENPFFARTMVNRVWYRFFGRGIVDPVDDFRATNPPVSPELLDWLTADFTAHEFDLRHLVRTIVLSTTYGLSSQPNATNAGDERNFSRALVRRPPAEVLADAIGQVAESREPFEDVPPGTRAVELPGVRTGSEFLRLFGKPPRLLACECERTEDTTLMQAFFSFTGETLARQVSDPNNRLGRLLREGRSDEEIVEELFLAALCRPPSDEERERIFGHIAASDDRRAGLEDVLWAVLNSNEFMLQH